MNLAMRIVGGGLLAGGIAYLLLAWWYLLRRLPLSKAVPTHWPPVSVMIPCRGATPRLDECLRSVCRQSYPSVQFVFGLHAADDPARPIIEQIIAEFPNRDMTLVVDTRRIGANPKNSNLANMLPATRHDLLVMVDSDVLVEPDFLSAIIQPLADASVGGVTCLYKATPQPGLASRLGALSINDWFIPSALVDLSRRDMDLCYGAAIAVSRRALEAIGGFTTMADAVAQDYVFGHDLRRAGFGLRLAPTIVETVVGEPGLAALLRHELRWNRAVRAVRPVDHALSIFMNPLLPAGLLLLAAAPWRVAVGAVLLHQALRIGLHGALRVKLALPAAEPWLLPLREILNAIIWALAFLSRRIRWGDTLLVTGDGLTMRRDAGE
jgi:ceramide glucosyltransferase